MRCYARPPVLSILTIRALRGYDVTRATNTATDAAEIIAGESEPDAYQMVICGQPSPAQPSPAREAALSRLVISLLKLDW